MLIALVPLLVAIVGLLIYALSPAGSKFTEIGRILFFCGTFVLVWTLAGRTVKLL